MTTNQTQAGIWGPMSATDDVLTEVAAERVRQDGIWGEQNHPDGTSVPMACELMWSLRRPHEGFVEEPSVVARRLNQEAIEASRLTWAHILLEEVCEALEERDPERLREELIQVGAVSVAWAEAISRRAKGGAP